MATTLTHRPRLDTLSYPELVKAPTAAEREARYQAALRLVERIEKNLLRPRIFYIRVSDKAPLTTLTEVVNAILDDDLLLPNEPVLNAN